MAKPYEWTDLTARGPSVNHVELTGHYGGDETHALSAWTSTHRYLTDERRGRIGPLLAMLAQSDPPHTTPFEKSYLQFLMTVDTATHIHLLKHRVAVSINGESARYKEHTKDKWLIPDDWPDEYQAALAEYVARGFQLYHNAILALQTMGLDRKRAKESARFFLPYASQVILDVSFNFNSFRHFLALRNHPDAQKEVREVAESMLRLVRKTGDFEHSLNAFGL